MIARRFAVAAAAWMAMAALAAAEPPRTSADMPTGDVWVTQDAPRPLPPQAAQNIAADRPLPTGDVWPAEESLTRAADAPAPPRGRPAPREELAADRAK
jgi:hypothetical protein